jgi:hypothetical protein
MTILASSHSQELLEWIGKLGIDYSKCRRVIVDIQAGHAVTIYVTLWGDKEMFDLMPPEITEGKIMAHLTSDVSNDPDANL